MGELIIQRVVSINMLMRLDFSGLSYNNYQLRSFDYGLYASIYDNSWAARLCEIVGFPSHKFPTTLCR
jgi:hypothetical protein